MEPEKPKIALSAKHIRMKSKTDFEDLTTKYHLRKNSKLYRMLRYGPIPNGDYSFLVRDGKITNPAKWLLLACELDLGFLSLCVLSRAFSLHISFKEKKLFVGDTILERNMLYASFEYHISHSRIVSITAELIALDYIEKRNCGIIKANQIKLDALLSSHGSEIRSLIIYVEQNIYRTPGTTIQADLS